MTLNEFIEEITMAIKKLFLIFAFLCVSMIALLYGVSPSWFATTFLAISALDPNIAHILRAVMGLYLALGLFWLYAAFHEKQRDTAILTTIIFSAGLVSGRLLSFLIDGKPSPLLLAYAVVELSLIPIAFFIYRL